MSSKPTAATVSTTTEPAKKEKMKSLPVSGFPNEIGYVVSGLIIFSFIFLFIGNKEGKNNKAENTGEFRMYLVNQDGSQTPIGKWYSMDSVAQVNSHLEYNYNDSTRGLTFTSKGPVDIYFPSKRLPGTFIIKHYCGKGVFNWSELKELCTLGTVQVFKSDDDDCDD